MPRDTYNPGELVTDDLGHLWQISGINENRGILMPELPAFLAEQEEDTAKLPGFTFERRLDLIAAERERCIRIVIANSSGTHCCTLDEMGEVIKQKECHCWRSEILKQIRSGK